MKWFVNKTFPHPVLAWSSNPVDRDYVNRTFQTDCHLNVDTERHKAELEVSCMLSEESLLSLIENGKARYATEIHCMDTFLRYLHTSSKDNYSVKFEKGQLHGRVEILSYVVCMEAIGQHASENFHAEFGKGAKFNLQHGDVLAVDEPYRCYVEPNAMQAIGTIFELKKIDKDKGIFSIDLDNNKIQIIMYDDEAKSFNQLQNSRDKWSALLASIYLMALCEALRAIAEEKGSVRFSDYQWFHTISHHLANKKIGLESDNVLETAQKLLEYPVRMMLIGDDNE